MSVLMWVATGGCLGILLINMIYVLVIYVPIWLEGYLESK